MVTSHAYGHKIYYQNKKWFWSDNNIECPPDFKRSCKKCGNMPDKNGHDFCLGKLKNVTSACCGHGIKKQYIIYENEK